MSKKQIDRKKVQVKLNSGDSFVVLEYDTFMYLASTFDALAYQQDSPEDSRAWRDLADIIRYQCQQNHYVGGQEDSEDW